MNVIHIVNNAYCPFPTAYCLLPIGRGDMIPTSDGERAYATLAMVIGGAFYGYIVGSITSAMPMAKANTITIGSRQ